MNKVNVFITVCRNECFGYIYNSYNMFAWRHLCMYMYIPLLRNSHVSYTSGRYVGYIYTIYGYHDKRLIGAIKTPLDTTEL